MLVKTYLIRILFEKFGYSRDWVGRYCFLRRSQLPLHVYQVRPKVVPFDADWVYSLRKHLNLPILPESEKFGQLDIADYLRPKVVKRY